MKLHFIAIAALISFTAAQKAPDSLLSKEVDLSRVKPDTLSDTAASSEPAIAEDTTKVEPQTEPQAEPPPETAGAQPDKKVFLPQVGKQQGAANEIIFPKDPRLCAFLSATFPGLGQLYQGRYGKAALFIGSFAVGSGVVAYLANENRERSAKTYRFHEIENNDVVELKTYPDEIGTSKLNTTEKAINISAFAAVAVSYIWSVVDAYKSAKAFNRKHFLRPETKSAKINLRPLIGGESLGIAAFARF